MKRIGIAGATGLVGETLLRLVEPTRSGVEEVRLFASEKSTGRKVAFRDGELEVSALDPDGFKGLDVAFSCLGADLAAKTVPKIAKHCPVVDKSSHFRLDPAVPLVVPEVNAGALRSHANIIANPNCTTIPLCVALAPLCDHWDLVALHIASYQSVSGAGRAALEQLAYEVEFLALDRVPDTRDSPFPGQIAGNLIPQIGAYDKHGNAEEESKLASESRKILGLPELIVNVTCVRVPVAVGHSLAVTARFSAPLRPKEACARLKSAPGVALLPDDEFATPVEAAGRDEVFVSRVRAGALPEELNLWVVTDNLRKGAALNAVQVAALLAGLG
ncbi:MAG: aspartate-semialdehyde dehydrogenase [bacterium]